MFSNFQNKTLRSENGAKVCIVDLGESFHRVFTPYIYLLTKFGFDIAENETCKVYPLSMYRSPRCDLEARVPL